MALTAGDVSRTARLDGGTTIRRGDLVRVGALTQSLHLPERMLAELRLGARSN